VQERIEFTSRHDRRPPARRDVVPRNSGIRFRVSGFSLDR
jgi:hypothetical protein